MGRPDGISDPRFTSFLRSRVSRGGFQQRGRRLCAQVPWGVRTRGAMNVETEPPPAAPPAIEEGRPPRGVLHKPERFRWLAAELLIVILGVMTALAVDEWREGRSD